MSKVLLVGDVHIGFLDSSFLSGFGKEMRQRIILERLKIWDMILKREEMDVVFVGDIFHKGLDTVLTPFELKELFKIKEICDNKNVVFIEGHHDKVSDYRELEIFPWVEGDYLVKGNMIFFNARRDFEKARSNLRKLATQDQVFLFFHEDFDIWYKSKNLDFDDGILTISEIKKYFPNSVIINGHYHKAFEDESFNFYCVGSLTPISFNESLSGNDEFVWTGVSVLDLDTKKIERLYYSPFLFVKFEDFSNLDILLEKVKSYPSFIFAEFINPPLNLKKFQLLRNMVAGYRIKEKEKELEVKLDLGVDIQDRMLTFEDLRKIIYEKLNDVLTQEEIESIFKEFGYGF